MYYNLNAYEYSIYWYEKIATLGHLQAQNNLGVIYYKLKDYNRALRWLTEASEGN